MYKTVVLINSASGLPSGWSEVYYNGLTTVAAAAARASEMIAERIKMLSSSYMVVGARLTGDIAAPPTATQLYVPATPQLGLLGAAEDYPNTAVLYQLRGANSAHQSRSMRGWPDSYIEAGPGGIPVALSPAGKLLLTDWINYLIAAGYGWVRTNKPGDAGNKKFTVDSLSQVGAGARTKLLGAVPADWVTTPVPVVVRSFTGPLAVLNGSYAVRGLTVASDGITIPEYTYQGAISGYTGDGAKVFGGPPILVSAQTGVYRKITSHKTGRPFGLLVGRRKRA